MEIQSTNGKIFTYHISDKILLARIYEEILQLDKKTNNPILKNRQDLYRHFTKENIKMGNKHMKRYSISYY